VFSNLILLQAHFSSCVRVLLPFQHRSTLKPWLHVQFITCNLLHVMNVAPVDRPA